MLEIRSSLGLRKDELYGHLLQSIESCDDQKVADGGERFDKQRTSLLEFTKHTFSDFQVNWHHRVLCEYLDRFAAGEITRLMVFMPPRYGKSELVSRRLPAYILGKNPDASIIATSYGADLAAMMNRDVQRIIDSPWYAEVFRDTRLFGSNVRTVATGSYLRNSDIFEVVGHRGVYKCAGIGGAITGMGCQYGIIDDPIKNRAEANSPTYRDAVWNWYTSTFYTRLEKDARVLITLTRWHEDDLAGRLLRQAEADPEADQWVVVKFPAIAEGQLMTEDPRDEGDPLWPDKYPLQRLRKTRTTVGSYDWSSMYQQDPKPAQGGILQRGWWKYWLPESVPKPAMDPTRYTYRPSTFDELIQSWDMAFKDQKQNDFVVGQVWGRKGSEKYLLDQVRGRMDFPTTVQAVRNMSAKWPRAHAKLIEDKANGPAVIATLKKEISGLIAVEPEGGKEARASAVSPTIEAGNVFIPDPSVVSWAGDFVEECAGFPNGSNDDQVDAMTQALLRFQMHSGFDPDAASLLSGMKVHS